MEIAILIAGVIGLIWAYGYVQKKRGAETVKQEITTREIELVRKANKIEDDHKHDSRDDVIDGL